MIKPTEQFSNGSKEIDSVRINDKGVEFQKSSSLELMAIKTLMIFASLINNSQEGVFIPVSFLLINGIITLQPFSLSDLRSKI